MNADEKVYSFQHSADGLEVFEDDQPMLSIKFHGRYADGDDLWKLMCLKILFENVIEAHEKGETYTDAEMASKRGMVH